RYASYTAGFNLKVVEHAFEHGNCAAGRHFSVNPVRVRYWRKREEELHATKKDCRAFRGPKQGNFPLVKNEVLDYVKRLRSEGCGVSHELIQNHAGATARNHGTFLLVILKPAAVGRDSCSEIGCALEGAHYLILIYLIA
ncbi:hypothetical protein IscW_ISCW014754, partial [Ixodes scapularis]